MTSSAPAPLVFTQEELDKLGRTADALSAYIGKPVLAELIDAEETGFEWVIFGIPLGKDETDEDGVNVAIGGKKARILGNKGGLTVGKNDIYECEFLWAIQLSDLEGIRFIKVDHEGDEIAWSLEIEGVLPFQLDEPEPAPDDDDDEPDNGEDAFHVQSGDPKKLH
ncbi:hypothetical protein G9Q38_06850 [Pusillimonas sp. DMV24BSW_D]|uniref:hypothetical protein n=1 Tax=Neopusillimonas aestuarii TaxID=2716226 RepID=UPI00140CA31B|nr:hypothetical protein [Pusillimonas sp. DMV24BSW_D]QIM48917.1 hypothetical protein G9Q38_06850 [Pusillimonas sp. DMV24BSW_D]